MAKMTVLVDSRNFKKELDFLIEYTLGTIEGIERGRFAYLKEMGPKIAEIFNQYIDKMASMEPETLHHVYEWGKTADEDFRLFKIIPKYTKQGVTFSTMFTQSKIKQESRGSKVYFKNKAYVMEQGITLEITPKKPGNWLKYYYDKIGQYVTTKESVVTNPGGDYVAGSFGLNFRTFFGVYLSQSRLMQLGMLVNPLSSDFSKGLKRGDKRRNGKSIGIETGYRWIIGAANVEVD